jgi:hypothetical protein
MTVSGLSRVYCVAYQLRQIIDAEAINRAGAGSLAEDAPFWGCSGCSASAGLKHPSLAVTMQALCHTMARKSSLFLQQAQSLCTNEFFVIPRIFLPQNQKMTPQAHHSVMSAMLVKMGGLNPLASAQGVRNLLTPYPQTFLLLSSL